MLAIPIGTVLRLDFVSLLVDALMALPNLLALILFGPMVFIMARGYFSK